MHASRLARALLFGLAFGPDEAGLLDSPIRARIFEAIRHRPGVTVHDLARLVGTTWPNAKYHVMRLQAAGLVDSRMVGRRRMCYVADAVEEELIEARSILREATARRIALFVVDHPGGGIVDLLRHADVSERAAYYHVKRLVDAGLLRVERPRGYSRIEPTPLLLMALA